MTHSLRAFGVKRRARLSGLRWPQATWSKSSIERAETGSPSAFTSSGMGNEQRISSDLEGGASQPPEKQKGRIAGCEQEQRIDAVARIARHCSAEESD